MLRDIEVKSLARAFFARVSRFPWAPRSTNSIMSGTAFAADENEGQIESGSSKLDVRGRPVDTNETSFRVKVRGKEATMRTIELANSPWGEVAAEVKTDQGAVLYRAEVVDVGHEEIQDCCRLGRLTNIRELTGGRPKPLSPDDVAVHVIRTAVHRDVAAGLIEMPKADRRGVRSQSSFGDEVRRVAVLRGDAHLGDVAVDGPPPRSSPLGSNACSLRDVAPMKRLLPPLAIFSVLSMLPTRLPST